MTVSIQDKMTQGERLLLKRMEQLPTDRYYYALEPSLNNVDNTSRPDAIIACWEYGIVAIEVKDWKNILEGDQQTFVIRTVDGETLRKPNPAETARNYAIQLSRLLEQQSVLKTNHKGRDSLAVAWHSMVIFSNLHQNNITYLEKLGMLPSGVAFGKEVLDSVEKFEKALKSLAWKFTPRTALIDKQKAAIRRVIKPGLAIGDYGTLSPLQEMLSEEALKLSENATVRLIRGVAGSGKSLVLVRRVQYLLENYPDKNILVLCLNKNLSEDLQRRIESPEVTVVNFDKFCSDIIKKANRKWPNPHPQGLRGWLERHELNTLKDAGMTVEFVEDEINWRKDVSMFDNEKYLTVDRRGRSKALQQPQRIVVNEVFSRYIAWQQAKRESGDGQWADWADIAHEALSALSKKSHPFKRSFDVIMLDEAQDFAPSWIKVIIRLLKKGGNLFICDDPTQSLFRQFSWKEKGIPVNGRSRILRVPFRNTREISVAAHALLEADPLLSISSEITKPSLDAPDLESGQVPYLALLPDKETEILFVYNEVARIKEADIPFHEIGLLYSNYKEEHHWKELAAIGVNVVRYNQMKGLEFRVVILPFVGAVFENKDTTDDFISDARRRLFTAMTRARQKLVMSHHGTAFPEPIKCILPHTYHEKLTSAKI